METTQLSNPTASSIESFMAAVRESLQESEERFDRSLEKSRAEFDRRMEEYAKWQEEYVKKQAEEDELQKKRNEEFYAQLGNLTNLFGHYTEAMLAPALRDKFNDLGFHFEKSNRDVSFKGSNNQILMEVDIILENGEKAILIEIKTKLTMGKINYHLDRLEKMREYANSHGDKRTFLGGIAGIVVPDEERKYALSQGLYLIELAGDTLNITPPDGNPKEW
jgi:hypothetical protein